MFSFAVCLSVCAVNRTIRPVDNIIEMNNATDSKFGKHVSGTKRRRGQSHQWPLKFCLLSANSSKSDNYADFKFDSLMFPGTVRTWFLKNFSKRVRGQDHETLEIHLTEI